MFLKTWLIFQNYSLRSFNRFALILEKYETAPRVAIPWLVLEILFFFYQCANEDGILVFQATSLIITSLTIIIFLPLCVSWLLGALASQFLVTRFPHSSPTFCYMLLIHEFESFVLFFQSASFSCLNFDGFFFNIKIFKFLNS